MMTFPLRLWGRVLLLALAACAAPAQAQAEAKPCALVLLHGAASSPQALAPLARKLQAACTVRSPELPWSAKRGERDLLAAFQAIGRQVRELHQQGHGRVVLAGQGLGANAALAYAGEVGDIEGVVALGGDTTPDASFVGDLPALAPKIRQHIPLLWLVASGDAAAKLGEGYAFGKAPPHPASRYRLLKTDAAGAPEAAAKSVLEWLKSLE